MPDIWGLATIVATFFLYLGVLTSAGTIFVALLFQVQNIRRIAAGFALVGLAATCLAFSLGGAALTGDVAGMVDAEMLGLLWTTQGGTALAWRLAGLSLVILGLIGGRLGLWVSGIGGFFALWSFVTIGHVPDRDIFSLNVLLMIHLVAAALWIGILTPLRRLAAGARLSETALLGQRFGRLASIVVPLLILAGLVMSYVLVGSVVALIGTGYGQALILKVAIVAFLLGLAAINKMRLVPRMLVGDERAVRHLSLSITLEWLVVGAILSMTAILTSVLSLPQ